MVTNLDIIVKKYPEVIANCLGNLAINKYTGEATLCDEIACGNCIFSSTHNNVRCTSEKVKNWLLQEVKVKEKESKKIDNSNNTRNSNGEITW